MSKPFQQTVKLALVKCLVTDESQMKIGAADQCNNACLESYIRKNGGEIRGTGDWKQINGGRDTDTQRKITSHQHFMHAGGECSHSGTATGPATLTIIEKLLDRAKVEWQFAKSFEAAAKELNNVMTIICAFRRRLWTHRKNYACEKTIQTAEEAGGYPCVTVCQCWRCLPAHNATAALRRIAEMEDPPGLSYQRTYFDEHLAQNKIAEVKELLHQTFMSRLPGLEKDTEWTSREFRHELPPQPQSALEHILRNRIVLKHVWALADVG